MAITEELLNDLKMAIRTRSDKSKAELTDLVEACKQDLNIAGIVVTDEEEALCKRAITLYCKANFGYDADSEKFQKAYSALKDAMALSGDYKGGGAGG